MDLKKKMPHFFIFLQPFSRIRVKHRKNGHVLFFFLKSSSQELISVEKKLGILMATINFHIQPLSFDNVLNVANNNVQQAIPFKCGPT